MAMALGLLWFSWICSLLLNGSVGLPAIKGYGYPYVSDWRNIGDDGEDVLSSPMLNWQASNNHGTGYSIPSAAQRPDLVPTSQNRPNTHRTHEVERLVNGASRDWGLDNLDKPLVFPLRSNNQFSDPAKPQPSPIQPQSSVNTGGSTEYASPTAYGPTLSYTQAGSHGMADQSLGNQNQDFNTGSSADGGDSSNVPHLVFEEVFHYPSKNTDGLSDTSYSGVSSTVGGYSQANELGLSPGYDSTLGNPSFSSYPSNVGIQPAYPSESVNLDFSRTHYQPRDETPSWLKQEPVLSTQEAEVSQSVSEPIPPPPPSSYIIQSRNGYQRGRYLQTNSRYTPEFPFPMTVSSKGVKRPAPSQPAAPKGVKNPERTKW